MQAHPLNSFGLLGNLDSSWLFAMFLKHKMLLKCYFFFFFFALMWEQTDFQETGMFCNYHIIASQHITEKKQNTS